MFLSTKANGVLQLISTASSQYYGTEFIHKSKKERNSSFYKNILLWITLGTLSFYILLLFGKPIIRFLFTEKWEESFKYLIPFYPYILVRNLSASYGFLPIFKQVQNKSILFSLTRTVPCLILIYVQYSLELFSVYKFWIIYLIIGSIVSLSQIIWYKKIL
jgi:O-antigen/teichoic acid export membrane protein